MTFRQRFRAFLLSVRRYLVFFSLTAFLITCCILLFTTTLSSSLNLVLTRENLSYAARLTFANVLLLALVLTVIDGIRRNITVERPAKEIDRVLKQLIRGDFTARIQTDVTLDQYNHFRDIAENINALASELSGVETLRTDFIANVSHELKTPLAVIQNYAVMLQQPELSEEKRLEYAGAIADTSRRLAALITNILKLNKLENQQIFPSVEKYDLSEQLCQSLLQFENIWEQKGMEIETDIADDVTIQADRELLSLVWNNLLSNAFKFTPPGGTVTVTLTADEKTAAVKISDTGCGMTPEVGAHIFEKFYQGDASHSSMGNGLGLALVKRVMDIVCGQIEVQSTPGKGSAFTVRIPRN